MRSQRSSNARSAVLLPALLLTLACGGLPVATPADPAATVSLPTTPLETDRPAPPPGTIPPDFVFPVPGPLNEGNADIYAQRALFHRTGSMCFTEVDDEGGGSHLQGLADKLTEPEGLLDDGRSYVGPLQDALAALDLEPTGIQVGDVAYGIGLVLSERALVHLPEGTVWAPRLTQFELADGRTGWSLTGGWIAVVGRDCL